MNRFHSLLTALTLATSPALVASAATTTLPVVSDARVKELQDLRWGMFICWSFSTFSGKEWTPGVTNLALFNPTGCDPDQWVQTAKEAGMGYILFLTKHHDGFCLWDTKTTDRKVTKSPLGRDVLAELKKSCDQHGIKLALYFSEGDWTWAGSVPGGKSGPNPEMKKAQLRELLTQYGPIEYIWFDHAVGDGGLSHPETAAFCKVLQPDCFVGFNHGPPLFLKRDNGSPFNCQPVDEVMARFGVLPLNNPPHFPRYNGAMEKSIRDFKAALAQREVPAPAAPNHFALLVELTAHELNHQPRRCLHSRTACAVFHDAALRLRWHQRERQTIFRLLRQKFGQTIGSLPDDNRHRRHATAWRVTVETWLRCQNWIVVRQQPKPKVSPHFPKKWSHN